MQGASLEIYFPCLTGRVVGLVLFGSTIVALRVPVGLVPVGRPVVGSTISAFELGRPAVGRFGSTIAVCCKAHSSTILFGNNIGINFTAAHVAERLVSLARDRFEDCADEGALVLRISSTKGTRVSFANFMMSSFCRECFDSEVGLFL